MIEKQTGRRLLYLLLAIFLIKGLFLLIDSRPGFFLGDSESYLFTATSGWIPDDRSFVYGYFLRYIALSAHSLRVMVLIQACLSAISAWLLSLYLVRYFRVHFFIAAACGVLCAAEPLQLLFRTICDDRSAGDSAIRCLFRACLCIHRTGQVISACFVSNNSGRPRLVSG